MSKTIHTAQVQAWGSAPKYLTTTPPPASEAGSNTVQISLLATGLHQFVRSRAAGTHFTSGPLPHVPGADGIGTILALPPTPLTQTASPTPLKVGQKVYFLTFQTGGSFTDIVNVPATDVVPIPEGADVVHLAAMMNPALSSWMALRTRTNFKNLPREFRVLVVGATSASGKLAVQLAKGLGAGKVFGAGRNAEGLAEVPGLDGVAVIGGQGEGKTDWSAVGQVDVILDYVYGATTVSYLTYLGGLKPREEIQYVHVGSLSGAVMELPGPVLRMINIAIRGSGPGSWNMRQLKTEMFEMVTAVAKVKSDEGGVVVKSLKDVETVWGEDVKGKRVVFVPEE